MRIAVGVLRQQAHAREQFAHARRAAAVRRATMPCTASGSAMICPTVMRGLSDAYGSWKITCIRRRTARSAALVERRSRSRPRRSPAPLVGRSSCRIAAAGGRLAAARLADQAERLAAADREADAVDRAHDAGRRRRTGRRRP